MSILKNLPHLCNIYIKTRKNDKLGGNREVRTLVQSLVPCWQQPASTTEIKKYSKPNISVNTKIYFTTDPEVTERHEIVIISRDRGKSWIAESAWRYIEALTPSGPDASSGLGKLFRVMGNDIPGQSS